MYYKYHLASVV